MTINYVTLGSLQFGASTGSYVDSNGARWTLTSLDGWGKPKPTLEVTQRPRAHGGLAGDAFLAPRSLAFGIHVVAATQAAVTAALDSLHTAVSLSGGTFTVVEDGTPRRMTVRQADETLVEFVAPYDVLASVQLVALDPRRYGAPVTQTVFIPTSSGGATWSRTWPMTWTGVVTNGTVSVYNPGTVSCPIQFRFTAGSSLPLVGPGVTQSETGLSFMLGALTLGPGDYVDVDTGTETAVANGQSSRANAITFRNWLQLQPGANTFTFSATSFDSTASFSLTAPQGAWL